MEEGRINGRRNKLEEGRIIEGRMMIMEMVVNDKKY